MAVAAAASLRSGLLMVWATIVPITAAMSRAARKAAMVIALISPSAAAKASRRTDTLRYATVRPLLSRRGTSLFVKSPSVNTWPAANSVGLKVAAGLASAGLVDADSVPSVYTESRPWPPVNRLTLSSTPSVTA